MIIEETEVPNVLPSNIDNSKVFLADNIIKNVYPLFGEIYGERQKNISVLKETINHKHVDILSAKDELEKLMADYDRKKKIHKLLTRVKQLIDSGIIYEGNLKYEMTILLKVLNKLSTDKIEHHIKETMSILTKRFSKGV
jgi:DNA-binding MarR family transcriptional regulator